GLQIAVNDALDVRFTDRLRELERNMERTRKRQRAARRRERALERHAVEVLHHHVERAVRELPREEHLDDVRVLEPRSDLGLTRETRNELRVRGELAMEDLHRDVAIDSLLERPIDAPHRADPDELANLDVPRDLLADVRVVRLGARLLSGRRA